MATAQTLLAGHEPCTMRPVEASLVPMTTPTTCSFSTVVGTTARPQLPPHSEPGLILTRVYCASSAPGLEAVTTTRAAAARALPTPPPVRARMPSTVTG